MGQDEEDIALMLHPWLQGTYGLSPACAYAAFIVYPSYLLH